LAVPPMRYVTLNAVMFETRFAGVPKQPYRTAVH
jgi:hypothetical protein